MDFPSGSVIKNLSDNIGDTRDGGLIPGSERSLEKEMATHSNIFLPKKSHGQRSLAVYSPCCGKELDMT